MKEIELTKGQVAYVDDEDFEWLNQWKWFTRVRGHLLYVSRYIKQPSGKRERIHMHREIMHPSVGVIIDHIDGNGLNNQKSNLRLCNKAQNKMNSIAHRGSSSKYKGVALRENGKWRSIIRINKKLLHLGTFVSEVEAAEAYNRMATELFGDFARLNQLTGAVDRPQQR